MSRNKNLISVILSVVLSIMVVAAAASAATTISTNISTDGTLTVVGNASLATITAGTWNGTAIGVAYGGTGAATAAAARTNLGLGTMAVEANTGSTTITTLGTIATGVWNGTAIGVAYGGTGAATAAAARTNLGLGTMAVEANTGSTTITTLGTIATGVWSGTAIGAQYGGTGQNFSASSGLINLYSGTASAIATSSLGLLTTDVAEGTNQYWTNTRFDARLAATTSLPTLTTLTGLTNASTTLLSVGSGGTTISKHLSVTQANVVSASIATVTCGNYGTITVTGAAVGDTVIASPTAVASGIETLNLGWSAAVTAANTVTIRACNPTAGAIDALDTQTWRADVWQH